MVRQEGEMRGDVPRVAERRHRRRAVPVLARARRTLRVSMGDSKSRLRFDPGQPAHSRASFARPSQDAPRLEEQVGYDDGLPRGIVVGEVQARRVGRRDQDGQALGHRHVHRAFPRVRVRFHHLRRRRRVRVRVDKHGHDPRAHTHRRRALFQDVPRVRG